MSAQTKSFYDGYVPRCTCFDQSVVGECVCCICPDLTVPTVRLEPCSLIPENEALRRRMLEMEILASRKNFEFPDEFRVLQAENNHFRDLTYSRLAEVEYWKKMYTNERNNYNARLEALRREYEEKFEAELKRLRGMQITENTLETYRAEWEAKFRAALAEELARLKADHERELAALKAALDEAQSAIRSQEAYVSNKEKSMQVQLKDAIKTEVTKTMVANFKEMKMMQNNIDQLEKALIEAQSTIQRLERDKSEASRVVMNPSTLPNPEITDLLSKTLKKVEDERDNEFAKNSKLQQEVGRFASLLESQRGTIINEILGKLNYHIKDEALLYRIREDILYDRINPSQIPARRSTLIAGNTQSYSPQTGLLLPEVQKYVRDVYETKDKTPTREEAQQLANQVTRSLKRDNTITVKEVAEHLVEPQTFTTYKNNSDTLQLPAKGLTRGESLQKKRDELKLELQDLQSVAST